MNDRSTESIQKLLKSIECIDEAFGRTDISTEDVMTLAEAREQCVEFVSLAEIIGSKTALQAQDTDLLGTIDEYSTMIFTELTNG
jgi:hypothetical protein